MIGGVGAWVDNVALCDGLVNSQMREGNRLDSVVSAECGNGVSQLGLVLAKWQYEHAATVPYMGADVSVQLHKGSG
jgi:hypothetical protein